MDKQKTAGPQGRRRRVLAILLAAVLVLAAAGLLGYRTLEREYLYPQRYTEEVTHWAAEYGVDPYLVYAVIRTESSFDPAAESSAGARGLMQMTEDTFEWIKTKIAPDEPLEFSDLYTPDTAIRFGTYLLAISLERYGGDIETAAAAYHSGWGTVDGLLDNPEYSKDGVTLGQFPHRQMNHYVGKITRYYEKYIDLYA